MALINFNSSVCNYTTTAKVVGAAPGSIATNTYEYIDLEMVPDSGYYLDPTRFTYLSNDYVDYVTFMQDGNNIKARVYLKDFTWPNERTDLEVPVSGCGLPVITTTTTTTIAPTTTTTTAAIVCPAVSGYFINKSIIELRGETRIFKVYGQQGATFSYTIIDNDNGFSLDTGTKTIPYAGFVNIEVIVPLTSSARVFDVTLTTAETCTLQLQNQPATFKLYQGIDEQWLGDTFECCEAAGVLLSTNCVGYDLYGTYTDGQCGTTNSLIETNSVTCGYVPPTTTTTTSGPTTTTTTTETPCTDCGTAINNISDFSATVGGSSGSIAVTGTNINSAYFIYTWQPNLVSVSLSGNTINWSTNNNNECGVAQVRVCASSSAGPECCGDCEDFFITVTGCTTPPATWDCVDGTCVERNDGSGAYSSLSNCQSNCSTPPPATWDCVSGTCVERTDGSGAYSSLAACQSVCTTTTTTTAAPSNCYALQLLWSPITTCEGQQGVYYGNFSNFCTATELYSDSSCTTFASSGYYTTAFGTQEYRFWDGTQFTTNCANC